MVLKSRLIIHYNVLGRIVLIFLIFHIVLLCLLCLLTLLLASVLIRVVTPEAS